MNDLFNISIPYIQIASVSTISVYVHKFEKNVCFTRENEITAMIFFINDHKFLISHWLFPFLFKRIILILNFSIILHYNDIGDTVKKFPTPRKVNQLSHKKLNPKVLHSLKH